MNAKERNEYQTTCPRCGSQAEWSYLDTEKKRIQIRCPDCGRYEMARERFDHAMVENAEINEPEF